MKKVVSVLLVCCMLASFLPAVSFAAEGDVEWDIVADFDDAYPYKAEAELSSGAQGFMIASSTQSWTTDTNRILRTADYPLSDPLYLTYYLEEGIAYFEVETGAIEHTPGAVLPVVSFAVSADGADWTDLPADAVTYDYSGYSSSMANWYPATVTPSQPLPEGTKYVRMQFGAGHNNTQFQICKASFSSDSSFGEMIALQAAINEAQALLDSIPADMVTSAVRDAFAAAIQNAREVLESGDTAAFAAEIAALEAAGEAFQEAVASGESEVTVVEDPCADLSMVYRTIGTIAVTGTNPQLYDGDDTRFHKPDSHKDVSIVYTSDTQFYDYVQVDAWYLNYSGKVCQYDITIEASPDDVTYTPVTAVRDANTSMDGWAQGTWRKYVYRAEDLPVGTKYVKINYPDTTQSGQRYTVQIGRMEFGVKDNFRYGISNYISLSEEILAEMDIGTDCTQAQYDMLYYTVEDAKEALETVTSDKELQPVFEGLVNAYETFKQEIAFELKWPEGAAIVASDVTTTSFTITWPAIPGATYEVYQNDKLVAITTDTFYTAEGMVEEATYQMKIIARRFETFTAQLGPTGVKMEGGVRFSPPDFTNISPDDFEDSDYLAPLVRYNDTRTIPYYYYHFHEVLNAVKMSEPNKGFIDAYLARNIKDNKPYNARIQEAYLSIAYFYSRNEDWNVYYNDPEVKIRLEAVIEHTLSLMREDGALPEYSYSNYSLAPTNFFLEFITQTVRLLKDEQERNPNFQSIDPDLMARLEDGIRRAIQFILTNKSMYDFGVNYSNQYGLIWSATMAYLEYHPEDTEIRELFDQKYEEITGDFISPIGFYYESGGFDMGYNLGVHVNTIVAEYDYLKRYDAKWGTNHMDTFLEHQGKFIDWLTYNLVIEPDGSMFVANGAPSCRTDSAGINFFRKNFAVAESLPIARAFCRSDIEVEEAIESNKELLTEGGAWPNIPEIELKGGDTYEVSMFFDMMFPTYAPAEEERWEAIEQLPYIADSHFTQFRRDEKSGSQFSYVRRPSYYTIFNSGTKRGSNVTVFGPGLLWHPEGGTFISSLSENTKTKTQDDNQTPLLNDLSWGTRKYDDHGNGTNNRVYEAGGSVQPTITLNGEKILFENGITDIPEGELQFHYTMGSGALDKTITYREDNMQVDILHPGRFQECFPLMVRPEDRFVMDGNTFTMVRGRTVMEIAFDKEVQIDVTKSSRTNQRFQMYLMEATTNDNLSYTITMYTQNPELQDNPTNVQVSIEDIVTGEMPEVPDSSYDGEDTQSSDIGTQQPADNNQGQTAQPDQTTEDMFDDIGGHWAREDINYLAKEGYIAQTADGMYHPDDAITRSEFVKMVIDAFGITLDTSQDYQEFSDVAKDAPYWAAVTAAKQKGIVRGVSDEAFLPDEIIVTQEMELIVLRAYQYVTGADDVDGSTAATKGQAAAVLRRLLDDVAKAS